MSDNIMELLKKKDTEATVGGNFVSIYDDTEHSFWCSESGREISSTRQWIQSWELFRVVKDRESGAKMLQSMDNNNYAAVQPDNTIKCMQNRSVLETHFKIDETAGSFQAYNKKFIAVDPGSKRLKADSAISVYYDLFDVKKVAISDPDASNYTHPVRENGGYIAMGAKEPYTFFLICNRNTGATYLETSDYEFLIPNNTIDLSPSKKQTLNKTIIG